MSYYRPKVVSNITGKIRNPDIDPSENDFSHISVSRSASTNVGGLPRARDASEIGKITLIREVLTCEGLRSHVLYD
jgi:hypothetical protein